MKTRHNIPPPEQAIHAILDDPVCGKDTWWNKHRLNMVCQFLPKHNAKLLDYGCAEGFFLNLLKTTQNFPNLTLHGYDPYANFNKNYTDIKFFHNQNDLTHTYDTILALDVIEHIENDLTSLKHLHSLLTPNGNLIVTVPAYQRLYGLHDVWIGHYRRYNKTTLTSALVNSGFSVKHITYIFSFLIVPQILISAFLKIRHTLHPQSSKSLPIPSDPLKIPSLLSYLEFKLLKKMPLPFGLTVFAVAKKSHP